MNGDNKGKKETMEMIVKNLVDMGMSHEDISKATGLSIKEIELLK